MNKQWSHSWEALWPVPQGLYPEPTEKTNRNAGRARLWGHHFLAAAHTSYVDRTECPWLKQGSLGPVVLPTGTWRHLVEPLGL